MFIPHDNQNLLDFQDKNLQFEAGCVQPGIHKGKRCTYVTYTPTECAQWGTSNTKYTVYKNGTQLSRITLSMAGTHPTYLLLKKQRFFCT